MTMTTLTDDDNDNFDRPPRTHHELRDEAALEEKTREVFADPLVALLRRLQKGVGLWRWFIFVVVWA